MSKLTKVGSAVVLQSDVSLGDLKTIKKYRPEGLILTEERNGSAIPVFAVGIAPGNGSISGTGVIFSAEAGDDKPAQATVMTTAGITKEQIADMFGKYMLNLNKLEEKLPGIVAEVKAQREAIIGAIHEFNEPAAEVEAE